MTVQFDFSDHKVAGFNIAKGTNYDQDLIFNESYMVLGELQTSKHIYATYNLFVVGDLHAKQITVKGMLFVTGDINATNLEVQKNICCNGRINVKEISGFQDIFSNEINCNKLYCGKNIIAMTTICTEKSLVAEESVVVGEGIIGRGEFRSANAVIKDFFDFDGEVSGQVFEISTLNTTVGNSGENERTFPSTTSLPMAELVQLYFDFKMEIFNKIEYAASIEEEEGLIRILSELVADTTESFSNILWKFNEVVSYSYKNKITNIYDFLVLIQAKDILPDSLCNYETVSGVFDEMLINAQERLHDLEFSVSSQSQFANALKIAVDYRDSLGETNYEIIMNKIFSSIGILFGTVKKTLKEV